MTVIYSNLNVHHQNEVRQNDEPVLNVQLINASEVETIKCK